MDHLYIVGTHVRGSTVAAKCKHDLNLEIAAGANVARVTWTTSKTSFLNNSLQYEMPCFLNINIDFAHDSYLSNNMEMSTFKNLVQISSIYSL